jgi:predicted ATPase/tRNA A-37 threonylcarbamoyl transferase component Bud32
VTPERWRKVEVVLRRALECAPSARSALVAEACGSDAELVREVESLLANHDPTGDFLREPLLAPLSAQDSRGDEGPAGEPQPGGPRAVPVPEDEADTLFGTSIDGKYRIEALLGRGGMGAVYLARQLLLDRPVAIKLIRSDQVGDGAALERFKREALAVARLKHPHIVAIHDFGLGSELGAYIVMEYVEGRSLRQELGEHERLPLALVREIMQQVCSAVQAAHEAGIVHRDLKPDNIVLERGTGGVVAKVLDFGIARLQDAPTLTNVGLTMQGALIGTPAYMSPEQCRGEEADARSDVYALGCMLYELLTGRPPFVGRSIGSLIEQHVNEAPRPLCEVSPDVPPEVEAALIRALAKAPGERPRSVRAFGRALGIWDDAGETSTGAPGGGTHGGAVRATADGDAGARKGWVPNNLPQAVTRFIGREESIAALRRELTRERLVTLTGAGGIGKTRLALEAARAVLEDHSDGVWVVELAPLRDPALVVQAVAKAFGVKEESERTLEESVVAWSRRKRVLLVLDNCEHLVEACAQLTGRLLAGSAGLRVVATSREALRVEGEAVWAVPALDVGAACGAAEPDEALASEAARLFVDRAALVRPGFVASEANAPAIAALCRRLEGIPLALELAAARVKVLSVEQILERLDDRFRLLTGGQRTAPGRQQTLRATLDWSYELLEEEERTLLGRLSVFAGGCELEAAEAVCGGGGVEASDVLDLLARLVDKSLVVVYERERTRRYGMLETLREYGLERLSRSGETHEVRRRHAEYFLAEAEAAREEIQSGKCADWLELLEREHDNVRAALEWLLEYDPDRCLQLAAAVSKFRLVRGHLAEARRWLETALPRAPAAPAMFRMRALREVGFVAVTQGDLQAGRSFYEQGILVAREAGSAVQMALLAHSLGDLALMEGDLQKARACFGESLALGRETGDGLLVGSSLNGLGEVARLEGAWDAAGEFYEEAVANGRQYGHEPFLSAALGNLGAVECERGRLEAAEGHYGEALTMAQALRSDEFIGLSLHGFGAIAAKRGAAVRAAWLAGAAEALLDAVGATLAPVDRAFRDRYVADARERLGEATVEAAMAKGRAMTLEEVALLAAEMMNQRTDL